MLDVYRNFYGLTGEPFRLGPDHRFSLHHESYANAKAYLEFAIYQGEGFIAISGGPGTGKTTLISEILAGLDRQKVEVATLTSTQLESRDLLYMVASSFDLHPEDSSKGNLLVEIESFLVRKIRDGKRAILIVDEAQGLSPGALEELRSLANLQYQYQLLLQIFLVGQEQLLDLIRSPGMEHLQQRLVAATSLDPLKFDETIAYIEHRLSKVGWTTQPSFDEGALREIYRYSGGTPRRINLIVNRLFLYGGMEQRQSFNTEDAGNVIQGLIDEFLLPPEPLVTESEMPAPSETEDERQSRCLPRKRPESEKQQAPDTPAAAEKSNTENSGQPDKPEVTEKPAAAEKPAAEKTVPDRTQSADQKSQQQPASAGIDKSAEKRAKTPQARPVKDQAAKGANRVSPEGEAAIPDSPEVTPPPAVAEKKTVADIERPVPPRSASTPVDQPNKKGSGKGVLMTLAVLVGAGSAYLLRDQPAEQGQVYKSIEPKSESAAPDASKPVADITTDDSRLPEAEVPVEQPVTGIVVKSAGTPDRSVVVRKVHESGEIIRKKPDDKPVASAKVTPSTPAQSQPLGDKFTEKSVPPKKPVSKTAVKPVKKAVEPSRPVKSVTRTVPAIAAKPEPVASKPEISSAADKPGALPKDKKPLRTPLVSAPVETPDKAEQLAKANVSPTVPAALKPAVKTAAPESSEIDAQQSRLRKDAEQRFTQRQTRVQPGTAPVRGSRPKTALQPPPQPKPANQALKPQASKPKVAVVSQPPVVSKRSQFSANEVAAALLDGRWSSHGKPASLLPSESTFCHKQGGAIKCRSVPKNIKTQYGLALYKVETTMNGFSAQGHFEVTYRTFVKLVDTEPNKTDNGKWQVTDYSMSCTLVKPSQVSCLDGKGVSREYRETLLTRK